MDIKCKYPDIDHNFVSDGVVLASNPPQYPETCKNCGLKRIGVTKVETFYRYFENKDA